MIRFSHAPWRLEGKGGPTRPAQRAQRGGAPPRFRFRFVCSLVDFCRRSTLASCSLVGFAIACPLRSGTHPSPRPDSLSSALCVASVCAALFRSLLWCQLFLGVTFFLFFLYHSTNILVAVICTIHLVSVILVSEELIEGSLLLALFVCHLHTGETTQRNKTTFEREVEILVCVSSVSLCAFFQKLFFSRKKKTHTHTTIPVRPFRLCV